MKLPPPAAYASSTSNDVVSSAVQPKTLPPRDSGNTSRSVPGMLRLTVPVVCVMDSSSAETVQGPLIQPLPPLTHAWTAPWNPSQCHPGHRHFATITVTVMDALAELC